MAEDMFVPGDVWLVGAGPGDPDLLTRRAERLIRAATVIFHDALVGHGVLALAEPGTRVVSVGKRSGRHSKDQASINALLLEAALAGEQVVRLKGGDPSIFGRSSEERDALAAHGIRIRICPGITAASAAAASAGISLTVRRHSRRLTFITAHASEGDDFGVNWSSLADPNATLAVYMGKAVAGKLATRLQRAGMPGDTPTIIVESASLPEERIVETRLDRLGATARLVMGNGPALLLIGSAAVPSRSCGPKISMSNFTTDLISTA